MKQKITLKRYVKRRNGVALGANGSLKSMFLRAFGAENFALFWHYWNPIWSYFLAKYILQPLKRIVPKWLAMMFTFTISGALHDLIVSLLKREYVFLLTPWFTLMAIVALCTQRFKFSKAQYTFWVRAVVNILYLVLSFLVTIQMLDY